MADQPSEMIQKALAEGFDGPVAAMRERLLQDMKAATEAARGATAESLNVSVRRLRLASSITEIGSILLEAASGFCGRVALLVHKGDSLAGWRAQGFDRGGNGSRASTHGFAEAWSRFQIPVQAAPALVQAIEGREAGVSLSLPDHLSPELVQILGLGSEEKLYLFPLCLRQSVVALLCADGIGAAEGVQPAALELLCSVAEIAIEALSSRPAVTGRGRAEEPIAGRLDLPLARVAARPAATEWEQMPAPERDLHLRAQRFARVLVADMQLYRPHDIWEGKKARDLYGRLKEEIDRGREAYQRKFGASPPGGIDYFHLELVRTLAEDHEELLGPDYPGPVLAPLSG